MDLQMIIRRIDALGSKASTPIIEKAMAKALTACHLTVLDNPFTQQTLQSDEKLKYTLADLRQNYNNLLSKISEKEKDIEKGRFSLGDKVSLLNQDDHIDALVFVNAYGLRRSSGKKALGAITLNPYIIGSGYSIFIGIVDARNGDVLAYTNAVVPDIGNEDDEREIESLTRGLAGSLKRLRAGRTAEKK
jgi:hypothetical protein